MEERAIMAIKLNALAASTHLVPLKGTFAAIVAFAEKFSAKDGPIAVVGTLAAALATGTSEFYSPALPRGLRLDTAEEVAKADLDAELIRVEAVEVGDPDLIVSGHAGTREILAARWPSATILEGNIAAEDIDGKVVAGTLPPHLVASAAGYYPASITGFDYSKDGDLSGDELRERLVIDDAVKVTVQ